MKNLRVCGKPTTPESLLREIWHETQRDAEVVAIGYCRPRLITRYFWLGGRDSRSAVRQIIFMCVVSCAENIGAHHTQYDQADFLIFMCGGSTDKKSLKIYKILMCVPPIIQHCIQSILKAFMHPKVDLEMCAQVLKFWSLIPEHHLLISFVIRI